MKATETRNRGAFALQHVILILFIALILPIVLLTLPPFPVMAQEEGHVVITVRDLETGYALPAVVSVLKPTDKDSAGAIIDSFQVPPNGKIVRNYSAGRYIIEIKMQAYKSMKSWLLVEPNKIVHHRFMLSPVKPKRESLKALKSISPNMAIITGYVTDDDTGLPLGGVYVVLKKKSIDTYTDKNGHFQIYVPIEEKIRLGDEEFKAYQETIVFSLKGYKVRKEYNKLIVPGEHLKMNVVMFKGTGEIIYDRTHKLLLPPEKIEEKEIEKTKQQTQKKIKTNFLSSPSFESTALESNYAQGTLSFSQPPDEITVGFTDYWKPCRYPWQACPRYPQCTRFKSYPLEEYVLRGVCNEWYPSWVDYPHSIRAGTVAYRSCGAYYQNVYGYICSSACCQAFDEDAEISVIKTAGIMLKKSGSSSVFKSEYSAQNNCLWSSNCKNDDLSCGDCYVGSPANGWPCLYDPVGCATHCNGHGRGMSQWGSYNWAKDYGKTWPWIVNHYYNDNGNPSGERSAYMTSPLKIISASPSSGSVAPGETFQISVQAKNYAGLDHKHIIVGASLYSSSTGYINDAVNDKPVTLYKGSNNVSRNFHVPSDTPSGTYDLYVALWLDANEDNQITTTTDLPMCLKTCYDAVIIGGQTLSVSLTANPSRGNAPLNGVDLTATVSGSATGTINYTFYCNRSDSGINITPGYDFKINNRNPDGTGGTVIYQGNAMDWTGGTTFTVYDVCNYSTPGTYTAKVIAERGSADPAEDRVTITVEPPPDTPPDTSITFGPSGTIDYNDVIFRWTGTDDVTPTSDLVYSYKLDGYDSNWSRYSSATSKNYYNLPNGSYTFYVKARDEAGNVDPSPASRSFRVDVCPTPGTPSNPDPSDGAPNVSINADLDWSDCTNTDSYDVYFGSSSSPPYYDNTSISNYTLPTLNYNRHYYWKIVAKNNCGKTTSGPVWDFTTGSCTYSISPPSKSFGPTGGSDSVSVITQSGCSWNAVSNKSWITITSGSGGNGNGTVSYSVSANTGSSRTGTITIAGKTFTVTQEGGNTPPTAEAGPDQTVEEGKTVVLDGSHSSDPDDGIASYQWIQTAGPSVTLSDPNSVRPTFIAPNVGPDGTALSFQLTVRDNGGLQDTDSVVINVSNVIVPGDIDDNGIVDLTDAVLALQAVVGMNPQGIKKEADVNGDGKIGLAEVLYVLQKVSGLKGE